MVNKRAVAMNEFCIAESKLEMVTRGVGEPKGENNRQAWIHQQDINGELFALIRQLQGTVDLLSIERK